MAKLSFYFDENVQTALADALKTRGIDVLTTQQGGNIGVEDIDQLIYAAQKKRTIFSYNKRDSGRYIGLQTIRNMLSPPC